LADVPPGQDQNLDSSARPFGAQSPRRSDAALARVGRGTAPRASNGEGAPAAAPAMASRVEGDGMWQPEPAARRWGRRALTIPGLVLGTSLYLAAMPVLLLHGAISDAVHRRPLLLCRFHLTLWSILLWHCIGAGSLGLWWLIGKARRLDPVAWRHFHRRLEAWWSDKTLNIATVFYGTRFEVEDAAVASPGPVLILMRHASTLDTILPAKLLGRGPGGLMMRIVIKRELLWDPTVDLMCHRVPRTFIRRGSHRPGAELDRMVRLTDGMDHDDALVIFPEGTRFSPAKQAEIVSRLGRRDPEAAARAARLHNVLPPRPLGTMALLDARPEMDVVFCAHTGFEGANRLEDIVGGSLLHRTVKVKFWRVPRAEVPVAAADRIAWLQTWWERVDQWIEKNRVN
jgi:1-acyl-sn-glycerol-3-phosphate acyltransferase